MTRDSCVKGWNSYLHHLDAVVAELRVHQVHQTIRTKRKLTELYGKTFTFLIYQRSDNKTYGQFLILSQGYHHTQLSHEYKPLTSVRLSPSKIDIGYRFNISQYTNIYYLKCNCSDKRQSLLLQSLCRCCPVKPTLLLYSLLAKIN